MALIKRYELKNGIVAENAYHVITKVDTWKRVVDEIDLNGVRPIGASDDVWKKGCYAKIVVSIFYSKEARDLGKSPIAIKCKYQSDAGFFAGEISTLEDLVFAVDLNSGLNEYEQAYNYIKTLRFWENAIDG